MCAVRAQRLIKARAVVIKDKSVGESNKQLTLFAKDLGKLVVSARGAKNQKSKFLAGSMPFCYCDFVLFDGTDFLAVTQVDLIRNFSLYYDDIFKLMYGAYFLELIDKTVMFSQESNDIMRLLVKGLHLLEKTRNPEKISAAFQIRLFSLLGLCPHAVCSVCGAVNVKLYYSPNELSKGGGLFCAVCKKDTIGQTQASAALLDAIKFITTLNSEGNVFSFEISEKALAELNDFALLLVKCQLESELNSLEFIKRL